MFNFGAGEFVVLLLLALIFLGPRTLPELAQIVRSKGPTRLEPRWSWTDWLLVCAAALSFTTAAALFVGARR